MTNLQEQYAELAALTQLYLLQEYASGDRIMASSETYQFFKNKSLEQQLKKIEQHKTEIASSLQPAHQGLTSQRPIVPAIERVPSVPSTAYVPDPLLRKQEPIDPPKIESDAPQKARVEKVPTPEKSIASEKNPAPEAVVVREKNSEKAIALEPLTEIALLDYAELMIIFAQKFPNIQLFPAPPLETSCVLPSAQVDVLILLYNEEGKSLAFIQNLAKAIQLLIGPVEIVRAKNIEKENRWEEIMLKKNPRLMITSYAGMQSLPNLMKKLRESPRQGQHFIDKVPLCLLSDISIYFKEPRLKQPLWQSILALFPHGK